MKTWETHYSTYPYDFYFRVFDDKEKIVTIELENEWSVSSMPCKAWEDGLAEALIKAEKFADLSDLLFSVLFHDMVSNRRRLVEKLKEYSR